MRVLVTGAAGFIGAAVVETLRGRGHEVVALDALIPQSHGESPPTTRDLHRVDLRTASGRLPELLDGVDVVSHQAAMVGAGQSPADLPLYAGHNDLGTAVLLAAMAAAGVDRIVLASSMVVYGDGRYGCSRHGDQPAYPRRLQQLGAGHFDAECPECQRPMDWRPVPEGARLAPLSSYAASKVAQEHYVSAWARQVGGHAVALRYHNVYGPWMPADSPYSGVAAIFRSALERGEPPQVFEDGRQMRDFVHVHDVARANSLAVDLVTGSRIAGESLAYNICSGDPISIGEVASLLTEAASTSVRPVVTGEWRPGDVRHIVASPERAAKELHFVAMTRTEDGLRAFADEPLRNG